jgi:hypothetical protein
MDDLINPTDVGPRENGIDPSGIPERRLPKLDKAHDVIAVPFTVRFGSPDYTVPNYKQGKDRYLPGVTMLVSILSHLHYLREFFMEAKQKKQAEAGGSGQTHLCEEQVRNLVEQVVLHRDRTTHSRGTGVAANVETVLNKGSAETMRWQDVARRVAEYLSRESVKVAYLKGFQKKKWRKVTEQKIPRSDNADESDKYMFVIVAEPNKIPQVPEKILNPHDGWKLVFAGESGGPAHESSKNPPLFTFANEDNQSPLWTRVSNGKVERPLSSKDIMETARASNILVYQRILKNKEVCAGKMVNILGMQTKVKCKKHEVPLVKVGRVETSCGRSTCSNKSTYVCREVTQAGEKCLVSLCLRHFKEAARDPSCEVFVGLDSEGRAVPQESYRVTVSVPPGWDVDDDGDLYIKDSNPLGEVEADKGRDREAEQIEDFVAGLQSAVQDVEGLVCELCSDAERPLAAKFDNPDKMSGMFLFNSYV